MNAEERKLFARQAMADAPEGINVWEDQTKEIPDGHEFAVVEILSDDEDGILFSILVTGDREGTCWAWDHVQANHPRPDSLRIMNAAAAMGRTIEIH